MEDLRTLLYTVNEKGEALNMRLNAKKTKVMTIGKDIPEHELNSIVNGNILERVDSFIYLG